MGRGAGIPGRKQVRASEVVRPLCDTITVGTVQQYQSRSRICIATLSAATSLDRKAQQKLWGVGNRCRCGFASEGDDFFTRCSMLLLALFPLRA